MGTLLSMKRIALLLLLALSASTAKAQIKTITGGNYQNTNGTPCAGCVLYLQLGTDATVIGTGQVVPSTNAYTLDVNGNVPANSNLWANDQMTPSGLTYKATLTLPGGGQVWGPEFLFISGTSPINLTQIVPVASSSVFFVAPALLGVANTFTGSNTFTQQIVSTVTVGTAVQVTLGVGCSSATNNVTINLVSYTMVAGSQALTFNPSANASITGNGAVDSGEPGTGTGAGFNNVTTFGAKGGTSIGYTTTSTLASTGCTTTPQYVIYAKAIF